MEAQYEVQYYEITSLKELREVIYDPQRNLVFARIGIEYDKLDMNNVEKYEILDYVKGIDEFNIDGLITQFHYGRLYYTYKLWENLLE